MNCRLCDLPLVEGTSSFDVGRHSSVWDCKRALMDRVERLEAVRVAAQKEAQETDVCPLCHSWRASEGHHEQDCPLAALVSDAGQDQEGE